MTTGYASKTPSDIRDWWRTPPEIFAALHREFNFGLDAAASSSNALCSCFFTQEMDALRLDWPPVTVWCNPPYSDIGPWVEKAAQCNHAGGTVVMLVPADPSVGWFKKAWETADEMRFISGRLAFLRSDTGERVSGNNKGSVLIIWRPGLARGAPLVRLIDREALR